MINEKNFFLTNKKINVSNTTSLVNLKAELFKKKLEIKTKSSIKTDEFDKINSSKNVSNSKWNQKAIELNEKVRNSIKAKKELKKPNEDNQLDKELKRSKENLERKTKIYEEKLRNAYDSLINKVDNDQEIDDNLIDFERKIIDATKEGIKLIDNLDNLSSQSNQNELDLDEQVEYQDSFGRTRYCKRKDLEKIQKLNEQELLRRNLDRDLSKDLNEENLDKRSNKYPDLYSNFIRSTDNNQIIDDEPKESHYQYASKDEIREHGTSYLKFSLDEEKRKQQMKELNELRNQTVEQRKKADEKLEKSNLAIKQRLLKLAKRKGLVQRLDDDELSDNEISQKMNLDQYIKNVPSTISKEDDTSSNDVDYLIGSKEKKLREWDQDKINQKSDYFIDKQNLDKNSESLIDKRDLDQDSLFFIDKKGQDQKSESYLDRRDQNSVFFLDKKGSKRDKNEEFDNETKSDDEPNLEFAPPESYQSNNSKNKKFKFNHRAQADQSVEDKVDKFLNQFT